MGSQRYKNVTKGIDLKTGDIFEMEKHYRVKVDDTESFYCSFINSIGRLYGLKSITDFKVITELCVHAQFNTGIIHISAGFRKEMCTKLELTTQGLSNSFTRLKELKLIAGEKGSYKVNPEIFWKGDANERLKLMKSKDFKISFSIPDSNKENEV